MNPHMFMGFVFRENPGMVKERHIPVVKQWWQKVIEWNPCNIDFIKPDSIIEHYPDPAFYKIGNVMVAHPETIKKLKEEVK